MDYAKESPRLHGERAGKIGAAVRMPVESAGGLSLNCTPGVAQPCPAMQKDPVQSCAFTRRHNLCAVITGGTAVGMAVRI